MELDLGSQKKEVVRYDGVLYEVTPLTVRQHLEMSKQLKGKKEGSAEWVEIVLQTISSSGFEYDKLLDLSNAQLTKLLKFITEKK